MSSAEGQVQNLGYKLLTFPLLLNISGEPTYFIALKDDAGLVEEVCDGECPEISGRCDRRYGKRV